jgi:hypothetical protein
MAQRMTLDEIERAYPQEWIFATDFVADDSVILKEGVVTFHSPDRAAALDALGIVGQRAAFWYVGRPEPPFSGTLIFLK